MDSLLSFQSFSGVTPPCGSFLSLWSLGTHVLPFRPVRLSSSALPLFLCSPSCVPLFLFLSRLFREFHLTSSSSERELCLTFSSSLRLRLFFQIHCVLPVLVDSGGPFLWTIGTRLVIFTPCFLPSGCLVFGFCLRAFCVTGSLLLLLFFLFGRARFALGFDPLVDYGDFALVSSLSVSVDDHSVIYALHENYGVEVVKLGI